MGVARWMGLGIASLALVGAGAGCGGEASGETGSDPGPSGTVRLNLSGGMEAGSTLARIAIRDVFDPDKNWLIDCAEKDHQLKGKSFCDELIVLPPGIYEVVVQSVDSDCESEKDHYKVEVKKNETTEIEVKLVCGEDNGALDTIVKEYEAPVIEKIWFEFAKGGQANKFICAGKEDVIVKIAVTDSDTHCKDLEGTWSARTDHTDVTSGLLSYPQRKYEYGKCIFSVRVNSDVPLGDYEVRFDVEDRDGYSTYLEFPLHLIKCKKD